jgi:hypothetical protein
MRAANDLTARTVKPLEWDARFCFVVGCGHSGTTLTAARLGKAENAHLFGWETNILHPRHGLYASRLAFSNLIQAVYDPRLCFIEKTPKHVHCANRINRIVPNARFVVVTRNPLDTCASLVKRFGDLKYCAERWNLDSGASYKLLESNDQAIRLRYEDLVSSPQAEFKRLLSFLNLNWDNAVLEVGGTDYRGEYLDGNMKLRSEQVSQAIQPNTGTWSETLSEAEKTFVLGKTEHWARALGYDPAALEQMGVV